MSSNLTKRHKHNISVKVGILGNSVSRENRLLEIANTRSYSV